jgi:ribosomal protein L11 methyltransferase
MLRGLDHTLANLYGFEGASVRVLDVGTGNGVLAIAALLLGVAAAVGVDIDPQACHEALLNARDHGVARRLRLVAGTVADIGEDGFDLVLANLRPPTLAELMPGLERMVAEGGGMLLSGFRREEQTAVERLLPADWFMPWQEQDRDWGALIARRGS